MGGTRSPKSLSRREAASAPRYYHGTRYDLTPGEVLTGGAKPANNPGVGRYEHVYMIDSPQGAYAAGHHAYDEAGYQRGKPNVYEVEPLDGVERDPFTSGAVRSKRARVVRKIDPFTEPESGDEGPALHSQAARWQPSSGIFGPTTGLDHRLFTAAYGQFRLRPEVRAALLERLDRCIRTDSGLAGSDWQDWTRVYLMGGSASEWAGDRPNDTAQDLDVIVAIDLHEAQRHNAFEALSAGEAASVLNAAFWKHFNADNWHAPFGGIWNLTAFCNQRAWYVEQIRPYAAWDLSHDAWAVTPPHLPEHTIADFSPAVLAHARAVAAEARAILRMDEPLRTREATALWNHVHEHRCQAFSPDGTGWDDPGNVDEKYLAYHPHHLLRKIKDLAMARTAAAAPQDYLRNPYHGTPEFGGRPEWSHTWFHGTRGEPDFGTRRKYSDEAQRAALPPEQRVMNSGWTQPNQHLGVHFSPLHEVGHKFAPSTWSGPTSIAHVRLRGSNPAHFETEEHLNIAMADWASRHYPHWHNEKLNSSAAWNYSDQEGTHRDFSQVPDDPGQRWRMSERAQSLLQFHPHMPEILAGFKAHLRGQGHHGITYGNGVEGPYDTDATRGGEASTKAIRKHENWPRGAPKSISAIADPEDIEITHVEHIAPWRAEPEGNQRTWEDVSDSDESDEMRDRVLKWHRDQGGKLPSRLASREEQLAAMDALTRASALAQETVRSHHPLVTRPLHVKDGQFSVVLSTWLTRYGHPLARTAYITGQRGTDYSCTGRGPDGEPAVMLHDERRDYGTLAHEAAHLIDDHESGRTHRAPHGPDGAHNGNWARHYASLLNQLDGGAGDRFLAERDYELSAMRHEASAEPGTSQRPKRTPGSAMVYLDVPHGVVQPHEGQETGHHIALAYLPRKIGDEAFEQVKERAREAAARHAPMKATISGGMIFPPGTPPDRRRASVVPVHAPGIHELHAEFAGFDRAHYETYTPHVTRAQLGGHQADPEPHPEVSFPITHLHVRRGDEVHSFPLTGGSRLEASAAAGHETWYHLTDNPKFALNPEHEPEDNSMAIYQRTGRGIYLTQHPESWVNGHDYVRPYVAEFHAHPSVREHDTNGRWGDEMFVPAEHFDKLRLHRVIPLDAHVREQFGEYGWIEDHHGRDFHTGEYLPDRHWGNRPPRFDRPYHYSGPDVREWGEHATDEARDHWLDYMRDARGYSQEDIDHYRRQHDSHYKTAAGDRGANWVDDARKTISDMAAAKGHSLTWTADEIDERRPHRMYWWRASCDNCGEPSGRSPQQVKKEIVLPQDPAENADHWLGDNENLPHWVTVKCSQGRPRKDPGARARWPRELREKQDASEAEATAKREYWQQRRQAATGYTGLTGRTAMIYLELPPGTVRLVPGGVDDHHITLVYLGKNVSDKAWAEACRRAREAAAQCPPMEGMLAGIDIFPPSESSDGKVPAFVPAYVGGIGRLRRLLEDLSASEHKDYRPHVTLAYMEEGDSLPAPHPAVPLRFTHVHLKRGDDVVSFPLTGGTNGAERH